MATNNQSPESEEADAPQAAAETSFAPPPRIELPMMASVPPEARLGERIKHVRKVRTMNIEWLSRLTKEYDASGGGLSASSISRYETGEGLPGVREFRLLCEALDVPVHWLMYGTLSDESPDPVESEAIRALSALIASRTADTSLTNNANQEWFKWETRRLKLERSRVS